jgi:L-methionine (R)-S-oxide reductase
MLRECDSMDKDTLYKKAIVEINELIKDTKDIVPKMATVAAVLKNTMPHFFWCGFYFAEDEEMVIGPYQGTSACPNIAYTGVCGTAARREETLIVPDVHKFPGHITCDAASKSEIVVPMKDSDGRVIGVLDVDSDRLGAFDETDKKYLESIMKILI